MVNKIKNIIIIILVVLILLLGCFIVYDKMLKKENINNNNNNSVKENNADDTIAVYNKEDLEGCDLSLDSSVHRWICYNERLLMNDIDISDDKKFIKIYLSYMFDKKDKLFEEISIENGGWIRKISKENAKKLIKNYFNRNELDIEKLEKNDEYFILQEDENSYFIYGADMGLDIEYSLSYNDYEKLGDNEYKLKFEIYKTYNVELEPETLGIKYITIKLNDNKDNYYIKEVNYDY